MTISISPLELKLDSENPRFVIIPNRNQSDIRRYLVTYEDVCSLLTEINNYGDLLPGERIVVLKEKNKYVVIEGNRRTCSLQILLSGKLIPKGFEHKIDATSKEIIKHCQKIEVDVLPNREAALALMTKRHIGGVRQWKPLAKKQFFDSCFKDGKGQTIENLSRITGISVGEIKTDIRDYKLFQSAYKNYCKAHADFNKEIIYLNTDPFWRLFKAKFEYPRGNKTSPKVFFQIIYDDKFNTSSSLDNTIFNKIVQISFEKAIVTEQVNTRNVLTDIDSIMPLLEKLEKKRNALETNNNEPREEEGNDNAKDPAAEYPVEPSQIPQGGGSSSPGGPKPGGPVPNSFFETISWHQKLDPKKKDHQGLLASLYELHQLSTTFVNRKKAYEVFPVASGMMLRTAYEQALRLRLSQVGLWGKYSKTLRNDSFPTLGSMEDFINLQDHKNIVLQEKDMIYAFDIIIASKDRNFLNANIHYPGNINVSSSTLVGIAKGGMFLLIQSIINLIP
jgi:hypothetical protein